MRHLIAISDIHLCEVERDSGLWMRYRQEAYSPDGGIAEMLAEVRRRVGGDELCLVLNGDVFDFDAPRVIEGKSHFHDLPRTAEHALPMMRAILDDHPVFVRALGDVLADGHEVVFVSGNHDVQLTLPEVRALLSERIVEATLAARSARGEPEPDDAARAEVAGRVKFRAWFHRTSDGIVIEHGNQYDSYCSFRYPMAPFGRDPRVIQPTMGSLATRNLVGRMGFFNPHVDSSFMLSSLGYVAHWLRYYLFSRHSLAAAWAVGAVRTLAELLRVRDPVTRARRRANIENAARETGVSLKQVIRHARLFARPAEDKLSVVIRELWLDRVALLAFTFFFASLWLLFTRGPLMAGAALAPAIFLGYELAVPKVPLDATWLAVQRLARRIGKVHRARAVVLGHTHHAEGTWENGVFYGNTGSWSAAFRDLECTQPLDPARPVVWLKTDAGGKLEGGLVRWRDGTFEGAA